MAHRGISQLHIDVTADGVVVTVIVTGELDITTTTILSRRLLKIGATHPERLVLDLDGLVFVDVAGARALDETYKLLQDECMAILRQPWSSASKVFGLTGQLAGGRSPA